MLLRVAPLSLRASSLPSPASSSRAFTRPFPTAGPRPASSLQLEIQTELSIVQKRFKFYDPSRAWKLRQEKSKIEDEVQGQMNESLLSRKDLSSVLLIGFKGAQLGKMTIAEALQAAKNEGYDLMVVNDKLDPPVCKLVEGHKVVKEKTDTFLQQRKDRGWKEIRISDTISEHDLQIKVMKMRQMIEKKIKLQFTVKFKDRRQYSEPLARALIQNVMTRMKDILDKKSGIVQSKSDVSGQFLPNLAELKRREGLGIKELTPGQKMLQDMEQTMKKHEELTGKREDSTSSVSMSAEEDEEALADDDDEEEEEEDDEEEEELAVAAKTASKSAQKGSKNSPPPPSKGKGVLRKVADEEEEEEEVVKSTSKPAQKGGKNIPPTKGKDSPRRPAKVEEEEEEELEEVEEEEEEVKPMPKKVAPIPPPKGKVASAPQKGRPQQEEEEEEEAKPPVKAPSAPGPKATLPPPSPGRKGTPPVEQKGQKKPSKKEDWSEDEEDEEPKGQVDWASVLGKKDKKGKK